MKQPPGFESSSPHLVCKLQNALYGLKQALRSWFQKLSSTLQTFSFHPTKNDTSLFVKFMPSDTKFFLIYVNDIIITCSSGKEVNNLISKLNSCFALKDLDPLHYILGIEFNRLKSGDLLLSQTKYINDLLRPTDMLSKSSSHANAVQYSSKERFFICHGRSYLISLSRWNSSTYTHHML